MWTPADRVLVGDFGSGQALTDDQFRLLEPLIPPAKPGGRPRTTDIRKLLDGLFTLYAPAASGGICHHLRPFRPGAPCTAICAPSCETGCGRVFATTSWSCCAKALGVEPSPTAAIIYTQSVKTTESGGPRGWDAAKRLKGRQRHIAVDRDGLLLGILVHAADIQDADSLGDLLKRLKPLKWEFPRQGRDIGLRWHFPLMYPNGVQASDGDQAQRRTQTGS